MKQIKQKEKEREHKKRVTNRLYDDDKNNIITIFGSVQKGLDWLAIYSKKKVKNTIVTIILIMLIISLSSCGYVKHEMRVYKIGQDTVSHRHYYRGDINRYQY